MVDAQLDRWHMTRALQLAAQGRGAVEPNPMVGCLIAHGAEIVGEGWHRRYGGPHAEVEALRIAGNKATGATLYATLEPCCHHGKTPPCTDAIIQAGIARVVAAVRDPAPHVDSGGIRLLEQAGIAVEVGVEADEAGQLLAPYLKLLRKGRPWLIAKWAMTLDGKLATNSGESKWITNEASRSVVHDLRGRVDAILVGRGTVATDDPLLTARPAGPRTPVRIVVASHGSISLSSQLVRTALDVPTLVAVSEAIAPATRRGLEDQGCEVFVCAGADHPARLDALLVELGRRRMTNVLVEGGSQVLGTLFDAELVDEVHAFIAPKVIGGAETSTPVAGQGVSLMAKAHSLKSPRIEAIDGDVYISGRIERT